MKNDVLNRKSNFSQPISWISVCKNAEIQLKRAFSHNYSNLYHYAANNPVRYTDPTGMMNEELETPNKVNDMASAVVATGEAALKEAGRPQFTNSKSTAFNDLGVTEGVQISAPMKIIDQKAESAASSAKTLSRAGKLFGVIGIVIATTDVVIVGVKSKDANTTIKRAIRNTSVIIGSMISSKGASAIGTAVAGPVGGAVTGIAAGTAVGVYIDSKFEEVGW